MLQSTQHRSVPKVRAAVKSGIGIQLKNVYPKWTQNGTATDTRLAAWKPGSITTTSTATTTATTTTTTGTAATAAPAALALAPAAASSWLSTSEAVTRLSLEQLFKKYA